MKMGKGGIMILVGAMIAVTGGAQGAEYFVNKQGDDDNNGTSRWTAFLSIGKGVDALAPGDTLIIGPGEYAENVFRAGLGNTEKDTSIRAEIPGTVLLRGDVPAPEEFEKVEGYRFVHAAPFDSEPETVLEHATMTLLGQKPNAAELEFVPGSFFFDNETKTLYISTGDQKSPQGRRYTVGVTGESGLHLERPTRVTIEGLSATGFHRTMARRPGWWVDDYQWGIILDRPTSCTVRDCRVFLNCAGIGLNNGRGNVVERCLAHHNAAHNIQYFGGDQNTDNVIRDCRAYSCEWGIDYYTTFAGPVRIENCTAWDHFMDYSTKGTDSAEFAFMEGCVALSDIRIHNLKNCILGGLENEYNRDSKYTLDTIVFSQEEDLDIGREFADPLNMDWRLQSDSRFVGAREDGKDRGLYPDHDYTIYFLSPDGDDENDGTSLGKSWRTFGRAASSLKPGNTLYLTEGVYSIPDNTAVGLGRPGAEQIHIRGRGRERVVIEGTLNLMENSAGVEFERISFAEPVNVKGCEEVAFKNCAFNGLNASNVNGLRVTHSLFAEAELQLEESSGVYLGGNIFANDHGPAVALQGENEILYSDYNSYEDAAQCWLIGDATRSLDDLRNRHDLYSIVLKPELAVEKSGPELANPDIFAGRGPAGTSLGMHREYEKEEPSVVGPFIHSVTDTTANIEWWTSGPTTCEVAWADTPEMEHTAASLNKHKVSSVSEQTYRFTSFSLSDLEPDRKYYFAIRSVQALSDEAATRPPVALDAPPLEFTTAAEAPAPKTYYVALDGDDANTGLKREEAWRSVGHAASQVAAGDTVMIAKGTYREMVRLRATGAPDKPITFRCMPGERVIFDGCERSLPNAIVVNQKKHIRLDGFYFTNFPGPVIALFSDDDVRVTRCFSDGRGPGYAGPLMIVRHCANVVVRNCVGIDGFGEMIYINDTRDMLIEHNVFLRNLIFAFILENAEDQKVVMQKNVCTDSLPFKSLVPNFSMENVESLIERDNCYYMRLPDEERAMFQFYGDADVFGGNDRVGLAGYQKVVGDTGSFLGNPWFQGTLGMKEGETTMDRGREYTVLLSDKLVRKPDLDFPDLFVTDPKAVEKEVGLVPEDFEDFGFEKR